MRLGFLGLEGSVEDAPVTLEASDPGLRTCGVSKIINTGIACAVGYSLFLIASNSGRLTEICAGSIPLDLLRSGLAFADSWPVLP